VGTIFCRINAEKLVLAKEIKLCIIGTPKRRLLPMDSKHLGDAFDHWKGAIIQLLEPKLQNLAAVPMITNERGWGKQEQKLSTYSRLLNIDEELIFQSNRKFRGHMDNDRYSQVIDHFTSHTDKNHYFQQVNYSGDLFLDPDTGLAFSPFTYKGNKHVTPNEIKCLLDKDNKNVRVIMVYQQSRQGQKKSEEQNYLEKIIKYALAQIGSQNSPCYACTYCCSQVSMLFFSKNKGRIVQIKQYLRKELPYQAKRRVKMWSK
jgi:hypothetical protein